MTNNSIDNADWRVARTRIRLYAECMPELSRFLGIVIAMYYRDHAPPHFHALYGEFEATIDIRTGVVRGELPSRALAHVQEWRRLHETELSLVWEHAGAGMPLWRIDPLE